MSVTIRKGYQAEIRDPQFAPTYIFAETLEELDAFVEQHFQNLEKIRDAKVRARLARISGIDRQLYRRERGKLEHE